MTKPNGLQAREYKLLLDRKKFIGAPSDEMVNRFWDKQLKPIIDDRLDDRNSGRPRHEGRFELKDERVVRYWDVGDNVLDANLYALRERTNVVDGVEDRSEREITLKLRTPDLFVAAATQLPGQRKNDAETRFEEDIAPLQVETRGRRGEKTGVVVAHPPSFRSRFAVSTKQKVDADAPLDTLKDVLALYPTLEGNLGAARIRKVGRNTELCSGPEIRELVFDGAKIEFGAGKDAELAFTLWCFKGEKPWPNAVEISFKCKTAGMSRAAAQRAMTLFIALQSDLGGWVNLRGASKTALALPR